MKRLNIVVPDFFGIKTASIKRYQKSHKWTDIYDWIVVAAENYINTNKVAVDLFDLKSFSKHEGAINFYRNLNTRLNKFQLSSNSKLLPLVDKCNYLNTLRQNKKVSLETINSISATLNLTINASGKDDLEQLVQDVEKQYPFLKLYKNIGYLADTHYNDMVESVKMFNSIL